MFNYQDLAKKADDLHITETMQIEAEGEAAKAKAELAQARYDLEVAIAKATLQAIESGQVDGRNAETRRAQIDVLLATDGDVNAARQAVERLEMRLIAYATQVDNYRAEARYKRTLLEAAMICARNAEIIMGGNGQEISPKTLKDDVPF